MTNAHPPLLPFHPYSAAVLRGCERLLHLPRRRGCCRAANAVRFAHAVAFAAREPVGQLQAAGTSERGGGESSSASYRQQVRQVE